MSVIILKMQRFWATAFAGVTMWGVRKIAANDRFFRCAK
jgi:hypothetical protein